MASTEVKLNNPPKELISSVRFGPKSNQSLIASSWDGTIRAYDVASNTVRQEFIQGAPVLDVTFMDEVHVLSGSMDNRLRLYDINMHTENIVGSHDKSIRCVEHAGLLNGILTGSCDKTVKLWDMREKCCVGTYEQANGEVLSMSVRDEKMLVATSDRKVLIWDLRNMEKYMMIRESSLENETSCIRLFPSKDRYAMSSIVGCVAVEYLDSHTELQTRKLIFKTPHNKRETVGHINHVTAISFHNIYNTFATGDSDGYVHIWDGFNGKPLCQLRIYDNSISSLNFSDDGSTLAIACSNGDMMDVPNPAIYVRYVTDLEAKKQLN